MNISHNLRALFVLQVLVVRGTVQGVFSLDGCGETPKFGASVHFRLNLPTSAQLCSWPPEPVAVQLVAVREPCGAGRDSNLAASLSAPKHLALCATS